MKNNNRKIYSFSENTYKYFFLIIIGALVLLFISSQFPFPTTSPKQAVINTNSSETDNSLSFYDQLQQAHLPDLTSLNQPVFVATQDIPKNWKTVSANAFGFQLGYPPEWTAREPDDIGKGKVTFMGFCMKPDKVGSCQDNYPFIEKLNTNFLTEIQDRLFFEERRLETIGYKYDKAYAKLDFNELDGIVLYSKKSDEVNASFQPQTIFLKLNHELFEFGFNFEDKTQMEVFSTLKFPIPSN